MPETNLLNNIADNNWTLFLDRDGVINTHLPGDYVKSVDAFAWEPGALKALKTLSGLFSKIIVVTNQRGIAKGLYTETDLAAIHQFMLSGVNSVGARIDAVFYCPHFGDEASCNCRKPNPGMALMAQRQFPDIDFKKSVMVGDSKSDIDFGKNLGMVTVTVTEGLAAYADLYAASLFNFSRMIH